MPNSTGTVTHSFIGIFSVSKIMFYLNIYHLFILTVCRQMKEGIAAVFGPITKIPRAHVQSICNSYEIPHLNAQWDARDSNDYYSISVYPEYNKLSEAYADLLKHWGWTRFTVIYEDDDGMYSDKS